MDKQNSTDDALQSVTDTGFIMIRKYDMKPWPKKFVYTPGGYSAPFKRQLMSAELISIQRTFCELISMMRFW